ncbi:MAG: helix-turn-helix domain-containing protein [Nitrospira sp.]|nr:helix-turn-helix domain-containing protein [Nitrospira sp.]
MAVIRSSSPIPPLSEELLTASDVCALLKVSKAFVYQAAHAGDLPCIRLGRAVRFEPAEVMKFVARHRIAG